MRPVVVLVVLVLSSVWPVRPRRPRLSSPRSPRRLLRPRVDRRLAVAVIALSASVVVSPVVGLVVVGLGIARPRWVARQMAARRRWATVEAVPEAADLLAMAVAGGLSVPLAVAVAGRWSPPPVGPALASADRQLAAGRSLVDVLEDLPGELGDPVRPLVDVLLMSERYGVPLAEGLDRVAREARLERRRHGEERARRVPVLLLFPLVLCILPAFGLLTVVPLLVGSLPDLPPLSP